MHVNAIPPMFGWPSSSGGGGGGGGGGSTTRTLLQTGHLSGYPDKFKPDFNSDKDMPCFRQYFYAGSQNYHPAMIFDTSGLGPGTVSSATLTVTPVQVGVKTVEATISCGLQIFNDNNMGTFPNGYTNLNPTANSNTNQNAFFNGQSNRRSSIHPSSTAERENAANYDFCINPSNNNLNSSTWQLNTPISIDVTREVNGYFANPHRVNCTEIAFKFNNVIHGPSYSTTSTSSNGWIFGGKDGSYAPTLTINHTPLTRTNIPITTGNMGNYGTGNMVLSQKPENGTVSANDFFYAKFQNAGYYQQAMDYKAYMYFPIANEIQQGDQVTKAYLSYATFANRNFLKTDSKPIYGDKTGTSAKVTSHSDWGTKSLTTNFQNQGMGNNTYENHENASIMDVTDIVNEIAANSNWDGNAIQFLSGTGSYEAAMTPYLNKLTNTLMYPTLSLLS